MLNDDLLKIQLTKRLSSIGDTNYSRLQKSSTIILIKNLKGKIALFILSILNLVK